ncbi:sn-glycerol-3-phosphate import ATP-binding protein UgpC [wastewater metagenome]|uniref:sn-glycerol-3-phosphate import ATP-binding protein UgpC n=2 Tax=unclassified sequences TaxID=12908 RepID=A0A5B8RHA4_9ZZZZ|nr:MULTISPECIES: ABC transporter ATP-binding protein [Arhodomonas]MCS4506028.1 ABC transporter ATP-binding protein [Arhodomonas aquaeolei]QEA07268.1 sn-glycerol-3-phosphate import ATP-binding protein UgpC [uncultured organism]
MARIDLEKLAHSYMARPAGPADYALRRMDHVWEDGGAYALLGPSGCGKTTLLNIISGLVRPSEGRVLFDGEDVTDLPPEHRNIAQVFQFPVIYDTMTVRENLAFPLRNRGVPAARIRERTTEIAEMLDLSDSLDAKAAGLGADAKQKLSMGRGLVREDVAAVLFDEPLTVIDPHLKWQLRRKLKEIHEQLRLTLVYVTHDQTEALTFADKVVVLYEGRVVQLGTPQELFERPEHTFVGYFIGSPGMNFLDCRLEGGRALVDGHAIELPADVVECAGAQTGALRIGIRPEFLRFAGEGERGVPARVLEVEDLGNYQIATVEMGEGRRLSLKLDEDTAAPSEGAELVFPPEWTKLYADEQLVG